jgi:1-acyl-sn-glycerol-3-phosphate acyltransferase
MSVEEKFIDVERAIAAKNPRLLKWLPRFLLRYMKRILHEDQLNKAIEENKHLYGVDFARAAVKEIGANVTVVGLENVPPEGGVMLAANHPLGGLDGVAFISAVGEVRSDQRFFVNDILMAMKNFAPIFVPVNKHGKNSPDYYKKFEDVYASDHCMLIFPAGLVSRKHGWNTIMDLQWKKSFITKAVQYQKDIIPVFIGGKNSRKFYNLAYWRKKFGIKANIEMFFLVDEMYKQRGKTINFIFGKAISWQTFDNGEPPEVWAERVKKHVYALNTGDEENLIIT